jgi:spermidine/putrescine transport system permease protein
MIFSFNSSKSLTHFSGFSLRWYERLINDGSIVKAVYVSLTIAVFATIISTILGTLTAIGLSKNKKVIRELVQNINNIPIMNPDIVTAIGLMILFSSIMMPKGYATMLLAHIAFCTPYVITSVYPKVRQMDPSVADAAMDLGATPLEAITKVIIPMLKDGIYAGILLSFTMSFDDFVISYFVTGNGVENISIVVYNMTKRTNPTINALSTIVILVIIIMLVVSRFIPAAHKGTMKRILAIMAVIVVGVMVITGLYSSKRVLRVFNSGEYLEPELMEQFEKEYDCKLIYETFDSNESMYTKIKSGAEYDVIVTSDYMIERLIKEEQLQPIDWSKITNKDALDPDVMDFAFDPDNEYSVPYYVGTVGILYNPNVVDEEDLEEGWELLRNPKYKGDIYMIDSERESFMIALKSLGYSMNTDNYDEIDEAYKWLIDQRETMDVVYVGDDAIDNMVSGNKSIAVVYSGDAALIMAENDELEYFEPEEGTEEWCDSLVITDNCEDTDLAHKFIDFTLREEEGIKNDIFIGYTSPVTSVRKYMAENDYEGLESAYLPEFGRPGNEVFKYQETKLKEHYSDLWTKVKAY